MNNAEVLVKFKGDTSDLDEKTEGLTSSFGKLTKSITVGNLAAKAVAKGFQTISQNIDAAIGRVDALNNFPKVMKNLGISATDSDKAIKKLSNKLKGLPTALNDAALSVQRITSKNGDVQKSTDIFLAMNNAILAGGAPAQTQANAIEQLSQAYAKGKPDMMEWRSLMTAMPAQLKQVAIAMGYVDADALGTALREGNESMDAFMNTIVKLNTEGVAGFENFETQAKNSTGGIQTSITNMKTAFARGVGDIISKVNESLEPFGGLNGVISSIGKTGEKAFSKIGDILKNIIPKFIQFGTWVKKNKTWITALVVVLGSLYTAFKVLTIINTIKNALVAFKLALTLVKISALSAGGSMSTLTAALNLLNLSFLTSPIFWIIAAIVALVAAFVILWNKCEGFRNFFINMWNGIVAIFNTTIEFIKNGWQGLLDFISVFVENIKQFFENLKDGVSNAIQNIVNFIKSLPSKIASIPGKIIDLFKSLPEKMKNIGKNIMKGLWNGIKGLKDWAINKVKDLGKSIVKGLKGVLGIHSPSTEFAMIGKFSILGYTEALDKMKGDVQKQIDSTFGLSPQLTGSMQNSFSPNVQVYNNVNVEQDPLGQMVSNIKTFSGGAKNDYNYGSGI